jgi:hypothetical protein
MAKVVHLFSAAEGSPKDFTLQSANELVPLIRRYTEEALQETQKIALKLEFFDKSSSQYKVLSKTHDQAILRWAEKIHRLGGLAKGLWTVDFDTGRGYLCWSYPEEQIEHFHSYDEGFKNRKPLSPSHGTALEAPPPVI